jgi:cell division protein FtsW
MGLVMVYDTTSGELLDRLHESGLIDALIKQGTYGFLGFCIGYVVYKIGHKRLIEVSPYLYYTTLFLLVLVFIPKIGCSLNGARRWIRVFNLTFQPSEIMKIILPLFYLYQYEKHEGKISFYYFLKIMGLMVLSVILIFIEPDNGTAIILLSTICVLLFLTNVRFKFWLFPILLFLGVGAIFAAKMPHVQNRIQVYLNPETDILGKGHQPYQAKIAAGSGGLSGKGLGKSLQKYNYLPEARSDYILAIFAEEFGFVGILVLILVYMFIVFLGFVIGMRANTREGAILAATLSYVFAIQAFLNMGIVSGLLPSKGTSLPLMSQGGSSLIANAVLICLLIQIEEQRCRKMNKLHLA